MKGTRILFAVRGTRSLSIFLKQQTDDYAYVEIPPLPPPSRRLDTPKIGNRDLNDEKDYEYEIWLKVFSRILKK